MRSRRVLPEELDSLPYRDPAAVAARRDLRTVHRAMNTRRILQHALESMRNSWPVAHSMRVLELGAGDGSLLLDVARKLTPAWPAVELTLLDRQPLLSHATRQAYGQIGWNAVACVSDVFDWAQLHASPARLDAPLWNLVLVNLFLHHFEDPLLRALLASIAASTEWFLACEPRRAPAAWVGSHLVGLLGVNAVTRNDAVLSVHAGFRARELSALWPTDGASWQLREYPAGLFSHCFSAQRQDARA